MTLAMLKMTDYVVNKGAARKGVAGKVLPEKVLTEKVLSDEVLVVLFVSLSLSLLLQLQ